MTDRPILFSPAMVRALLDGRKTQTRRVVDFPGIDKVLEFVRVGTRAGTGEPVYEMKDRFGQIVTRPKGKHSLEPHFWPRYAVGDRLYLREAWRTAEHLNQFSPKVLPVDSPLSFEADASGDRIGALGKFRQGMHMPRWASRLTLTVTDVRVQRLQEISEQDAIAEGIAPLPSGRFHCGYDEEGEITCKSPVTAYAWLWNSLNEDRGFGWQTNPWIVAVTFTVDHRNVDEVSL